MANSQIGGEIMADQLLGKITHYYDKIGVAVVEVQKPFSLGDEIKISGSDHEFVQKVESMQIEHEQIQQAKKGQTIGLRTDQKVKEGDVIFKGN
ncbi:U32 family peptidase C-terminal domain-containing protein [Candidatus Microgenomates bacterium]|nr:U32 family peptidase C-terminal domain-containing protein [Candidatus Microgenomates bacterium]